MNLLSLIFSFIFMLQPNSLQREISTYLEKQLPEYIKIDFVTLSSPKLKGNEVIKIDESRLLKVSGSLAYVPVLIIGPGKSAQSLISLKIKLFREVITARRALTKGEEIKVTDLEWRQQDITQIRGTVLYKMESVENSKAKVAIRQDDVMTKEMLQQIPVIKKGDKVTAIAVRGNVEISMDAFARQDGCIGDIIQIVNSNKISFKAKVIDQFSVNIIE